MTTFEVTLRFLNERDTPFIMFEDKDTGAKYGYYYPITPGEFEDEMKKRGFEDWQIRVAASVVRVFSSFYYDVDEGELDEE